MVLVGSNLILWAVMEPWRRRRIVREIREEIKEWREEMREKREDGLLEEMKKVWPPTPTVMTMTGDHGMEETLNGELFNPALTTQVTDAPTAVSLSPLTSPSGLNDPVQERTPLNESAIFRTLAQDPLNDHNTLSGLRPLDLTTLAIGAAAAGCILTGSIGLILLKAL